MTAAMFEDPKSVLDGYVAEINAYGEKIGLPYIAASSDMGDPEPMRGADGKPLAETAFRWFDPNFRYWDDRTFALRSGFVQASRICAEPFYFDGKKLATWRESIALNVFNAHAEYELFGVRSAIICPCYMPFGVLGSVVWISNEDVPEIASVFAEYGERLQILTLKFLSTHRELGTIPVHVKATDLTRREIQCLKWAALGKTDSEIGTILNVSVPTVRFHLVNASKKFGVRGRAQAVRIATSLGFVGSRGTHTCSQ